MQLFSEEATIFLKTFWINLAQKQPKYHFLFNKKCAQGNLGQDRQFVAARP